jgi:hypothetical protein
MYTALGEEESRKNHSLLNPWWTGKLAGSSFKVFINIL